MNNTAQTQDRQKIAFIDDEDRILRSMRLLFKKHYDVFVTTDATEYVNYIKSNNVLVAISDQRMPKVTGVEVLQAVKDVSPSTMRILLTGYADLNAILGSINEGEIYRYLTKPCKSDELKETIDQAAQIALETQSAGLDTIDFATSKHVEQILLIDDNSQLLSEFQKMLGSMYKVHTATNITEAYGILEKNDIGVCVTDINVSGENIAPIIYTLKQHAPHLVVLIQTSFKDAHQLISLINKGQVFRCLPKPVRPSLLEISIQRAMKQHHKLKSSPVMVKRHQVEVKEDVQEEQVVSKTIRGFISRIRNAFATV